MNAHPCSLCEHTATELGCQVRHTGEDLRLHGHDLHVARKGNPFHDQDTVGCKSWHALQVVYDVFNSVRPCRRREHHFDDSTTSCLHTAIDSRDWI